MKRISFALTADAILNRTKTVTRRLGWKKLGPGEKLLAVDKLRTRSGDWPFIFEAQKLAVIEIVSVRRERLSAVTNDDVTREGFSDRGAAWFVEMFRREMGVTVADPIVTRIEFRYLDAYEL